MNNRKDNLFKDGKVDLSYIFLVKQTIYILYALSSGEQICLAGRVFNSTFLMIMHYRSKMLVPSSGETEIVYKICTIDYININ